MTQDPIEERVARYLERSEHEPGLTPEEFAGAWPDDEHALLDAIRSTLAVKALFPARAMETPQSIGDYCLVREIGRGGMGIVYEARRGDNRHALKLLRPSFLCGPKTSERFLRECNTLKRLSHPHIVRVHDHGISGEHLYLVMELVSGRTLTEVELHTTRDEALFLVERLAHAVHTAHELGVLHRDLKPQNVMLREDGSPVLLDFGLVADDLEPSITSTDEVLGTPRYMAPEQVRGERATVRTDVHGLGMILYELTVGRPVRMEDTRAAVLRRALEGHVVPPRRVVSTYPRQLERITCQALARDPRDRYASAAALAEDLARFRAGDPVVGRPPRPWTHIWRHLRAHPLRVAITLALIAWTIAIWWSTPSTKEYQARDARIRRHLDQAVAALLHDHHDEARGEIERAVTLDGTNSDVLMLRDAVERRTPLDDDFVAHLASRESAHALALVAARRRLTGDTQDLETFLRDALGNHAQSLALSSELAEWLDHAGRTDDATSWFERCVHLVPQARHPRERLALHWKARGKLDRAVETLLQLHEEGLAPVVQPLLDRLAEREVILSLLRDELLEHPDRLATHRVFAYACDSDHRLEEARDHYEFVLGRVPDDRDVMVWLANLYAGADRSTCQACQRAFAESPDVLDPTRAENLLIDLVRSDQGRSEHIIANLLYVANKLPSTQGLRQALGRLSTEVVHDSGAKARLDRVSRTLTSRLAPAGEELDDGVEIGEVKRENDS